MFVYQAGVLLNLSRDAQRQATVSFIGSLSGAGTPVTDRLLPESAAAQARSLEGRPLAMYSSLMLPDRSRLRLSESWPRFAAAFVEQSATAYPGWSPPRALWGGSSKLVARSVKRGSVVTPPTAFCFFA